MPFRAKNQVPVHSFKTGINVLCVLFGVPIIKHACIYIWTDYACDYAI